MANQDERVFVYENAAVVAGIYHARGLSKGKFFKMTVGQTFCTYLTSFRIARAQHMLLNNEIPIAEISQLVGFCSQSYFGEVFRSTVGMTPRAYRQRSCQSFVPSVMRVNLRESTKNVLVAGPVH